MNEPDWFRALLDTSSDVYFRYSLLPSRRFVYLSPSVEALTGHPPQAFYDNAALCLTIIAREDRRLLHQVLRARRGLTLTLDIKRRLYGAHEKGLYGPHAASGSDRSTLVPVTLRTATVVRHRRIVAIEGVIAVGRAGQAGGAGRAGGAGGAGGEGEAPTQQRLAALMYEVHDLLHRVLPEPSKAPASRRTYSIGDLVLDADRLTVSESGSPVALTSREVMVLRYMFQNTGRVVTRAQLLTDVWDQAYTGDDRTVDVHISRLRRKLPSLRSYLVAVKHVGYRLDVDEEPSRLANF